MRYGAGSKLMMVAALLLGPTTAARAEGEDDAPGRGVARISVINGDVSVRRGDSGDWVAAAVNAPLVVEDAISTGPGSRAEVQFDYANMLRMGPNAEVRLTEIENRRYLMQVARGTVEFRVLRNSDAYVEVSTPQVSVRPSKKGAYRVTVMEDGQALITTRSGDVEIYTPRGVEELHSGKSILVRGGPDGPEFQAVSATPRDEFDKWNEDRDRYLERSVSYKYVNASVYGADDLDGHGRWVYDQPYGWVWAPSVGAGWAPYSYGRWVWQDWYGWTWLSYDSWGWAPFHYGRWYHGGHGWCWYPGGIGTVHYYRPALVAFFGFGGAHVGVGFGGYGRVGWVPLGPHEPFHAWYGRGYYNRGGYVDRSVNITNVNITNVYRNTRVNNAVSVVDANGFGRGGHNIQRVSDVREANVMRGPLPVAPTRESLRFADRDVRNVPRAAANDKFYSRRQPTPVERISFADQQRRFQGGAEHAATPQSGGATQPGVSRTTDAGARQSNGWRQASEPARTAEKTAGQPADTSKGWRRAGETGRTPGSTDGRKAESAPQSTESRQGNWRRFGTAQEQTREAGTATPAASKRSEGASAPARSSEDRQNGWKRFGEPGQSDNRQAAPAKRQDFAPERKQDSGSRNWQGFGNPGSTRSTESAPRVESRPRDTNRGMSRSESAPRSESIRIAPPVVRERSSTPRMESAPRVERSAPQVQKSAPSSEGRAPSGQSSGSPSRSGSGGHGGGRNR